VLPLTAQQAAILTCDAPEVDFGCELLTLNLSFIEDISVDVTGGRVSRNMNRSPHGQLQLGLSRELDWGNVVVRPWMKIRDTVAGGEAQWYTGAYVLTVPEQPEGEDVPLFDVAGDDRTYLLDRPVAADHSAAAGVTYRQALLDAFAGAGLAGVRIDGAAADSTLPTARSWPLVGKSSDPDQTNTPVTWRRVVNDLLEAINFRAVWADDSGLFRCEAYRDPASRPSEFTFDGADEFLTIVGEKRARVQDVRKAPNRWVFRWSNAPDGTVTTTYQVTLPDEHPLSALNRGLDWPVVYDYEAASYAKLVELGDRRVAYDLRVTSSLKVHTGPFPCAGHADVFDFIDAEHGLRKVQAALWSFSLDGSEVDWEWEVVS
jgi:hypothetical protein